MSTPAITSRDTARPQSSVPDGLLGVDGRLVNRPRLLLALTSGLLAALIRNLRLAAGGLTEL